MVSTVTELTRATILTSSYAELSTTIGLAATLLLLFFLTQRLVLSVIPDQPVNEWRRQVLDLAIRPLSLAFVLAMITRLLAWL